MRIHYNVLLFYVGVMKLYLRWIVADWSIPIPYDNNLDEHLIFSVIFVSYTIVILCEMENIIWKWHHGLKLYLYITIRIIILTFFSIIVPDTTQTQLTPTLRHRCRAILVFEKKSIVKKLFRAPLYLYIYRWNLMVQPIT